MAKRSQNVVKLKPRVDATPKARQDLFWLSPASVVLDPRNAYSRYVYWLKIVLPGLALALLLTVLAWPELIGSDQRFRITAQDITEHAQQASYISRPRYVGSNRSGLAYSIGAEMAVPVQNEPQAINMQTLMVEIKKSADTTVSLHADRATYWRDRHGMAVQGNIRIIGDNGYDLRTDQAYADFNRGVIWGTGPISGKTPLGTIAAEGFEAAQDGGMIKLSGKSRVTLQSGGKSKAQL